MQKLFYAAFRLSRSPLFAWFFWVYNVGVLLTSAMLITHGTLTVLGEESGEMVAGIAGIGHIIITVGMVLLFLALGAALREDRAEAAKSAAAEAPAA